MAEFAELGRAAGAGLLLWDLSGGVFTWSLGGGLEWVEVEGVDGAGRLAVIVGEAGIGKSRLVHEFLRTVARGKVLALDGGAAPYGSGAGYRPGVHILRQYFNIGEADDVPNMVEFMKALTGSQLPGPKGGVAPPSRK